MMKSLAFTLAKSFAVFSTVTVFVTVAVAGLAPRAHSDGKDTASFIAVSDTSTGWAGSEDTVAWTAELVISSDRAPKCARAGTSARLWPVGSTPYGRSYDEWSQDWWRWALSRPTGINPILDVTGDRCSYGPRWQVSWYVSAQKEEHSSRPDARKSRLILRSAACDCDVVNSEIGSCDDANVGCTDAATV